MDKATLALTLADCELAKESLQWSIYNIRNSTAARNGLRKPEYIEAEVKKIQELRGRITEAMQLLGENNGNQ